MSDRDYQVLLALHNYTEDADALKLRRKYARPMDVGGFNGSHHGATLAKLCSLGLAERQRWFIGTRHTNYYRITDADREALKQFARERTS